MNHSLINSQIADQLITYQLGSPAHTNQNHWKIVRPEEVDSNWTIAVEHADAVHLGGVGVVLCHQQLGGVPEN
jgi:hypothetical protein